MQFWTPPKKKSLGPDDIASEVYESVPILHNLLQKTEETGIFSNRFYETGIILILKSKTVQIKRAIDQYPILWVLWCTIKKYTFNLLKPRASAPRYPTMACGLFWLKVT